MRILVCGGRNYAVPPPNATAQERALARRQLVCIGQALSDYCSRGVETDTVIHGGASGADNAAGRMARELNLEVEVHPADWKKHGRAAGPIRNQEMLDSGVDLVLAFPGGRGTADMVRRAREAGVEVKEINEEEFFRGRV